MKERKKNKAPTLLGIMCSDYNLPYLENCLHSLEKTMGDDVDVTIFGFNGRKEIPLSHTRTRTHCIQRDLPYVFLGNQDYVPMKKKYLTNRSEVSIYRFDILIMFRFCEMMYKKGYEEVYILHPDTIILKDFRPLFNKHKEDDWSIIMPFVSIKHPPEARRISREITYEEACKLNSYDIAKTDVRLTGSIVLHNKKFIEAIYKQYGTEEKMFNELFLNTKYCGDCGWFDMIDCIGFKIRPIFDNILSELPVLPRHPEDNFYWLHGIPAKQLVTSLGFSVGSKNISKALEDYL